MTSLKRMLSAAFVALFVTHVYAAEPEVVRIGVAQQAVTIRRPLVVRLPRPHNCSIASKMPCSLITSRSSGSSSRARVRL